MSYARSETLTNMLTEAGLCEADFVLDGAIRPLDEVVAEMGELPTYIVLSYSPEDNGYFLDGCESKGAAGALAGEFVSQRVGLVVAVYNLDSKRALAMNVIVNLI